MATILVGYDTETAAVGEALSLFTESPNFPLYAKALDPETCARGTRVADRGSTPTSACPGTLFVCGRTLLHALEPVRAAKASGLFDIQQHTFSHVPFQRHRLLARARNRRDDPGLAARGAPRGARLHLAADPRARRQRVRRRCGRRSATTAACATGPTCSRSSAQRGCGTSPRGAGTPTTATRRRGCSRSPTRRRATRTSSSCRSSSGSTWSGSTSTATTSGPALLEALKGAVDEVAEQRPRLRRVLPRLGRCSPPTSAGSAGSAASSPTPGSRASRSRPTPTTGAGSPAHDAPAVPLAQKAVSITGKCGPWIGSPGAHSSSSSV